MRDWEVSLANVSSTRIKVAPVRYTSRRQVGPRCGYVCATIVARLLERSRLLRRAGVSFGHDLLHNPDWGFDVADNDNDVCENPVPVVMLNTALGKSGSSGTVHWLSDSEIASGINFLSDNTLAEQVRVRVRVRVRAFACADNKCVISPLSAPQVSRAETERRHNRHPRHKFIPCACITFTHSLDFPLFATLERITFSSSSRRL
jgi:hypothetical protein